MWRRKRGPEQDEDPFELGVAAWQSTPRDLVAVKHWWESAAAADDTRAMNALGVLYAAEVEPRDSDEARRWFRQAADKGDSFASYQLGLLASSSEPPDNESARAWWQRAAEAGNVNAMTALGELYERRFAPPDIVTARNWYLRAAGEGDAIACYRLGVLAATFDPPNHDVAQEWWQLAADAGHVLAMGCLGDLYAARVPPDTALSRHWWERAAEGGLGDAMYRLGTVALNEQPSARLDVTISWYERAAEAGHAGAMFALGTLYEGVVDPPDLDAARRWFRRAIDAGHDVAAKSLEALTASWTTPHGWGEKPPTSDQIAAMADWLGRHEGVFDELRDGTEPAMDAIYEALLNRNVPALRSACGQTGRLYCDGLGAVEPTPDADLTEAIHMLADAGKRLRHLGPELPDHPQECDVLPIQGCVADIGSSLDRMMSIHERDREIVEAEDG